MERIARYATYYPLITFIVALFGLYTVALLVVTLSPAVKLALVITTVFVVLLSIDACCLVKELKRGN